MLYKNEKINLGEKKYGRLERMFRDGYVAVLVYVNVYVNKTFYDIVITRKIKRNDKQEYVRGANLKPDDIDSLVVLLNAAKDYISSVRSNNQT